MFQVQAQEALRAYQFDWDDEMVRAWLVYICVYVSSTCLCMCTHHHHAYRPSGPCPLSYFLFRHKTNPFVFPFLCNAKTFPTTVLQVDYNLIRELLVYIVNSGYEQVCAH